MRTLDHWKGRLSALPTTIDCAEMRIIGNDYCQPVFVGPGHVDIRSATDIDFTMYATAANEVDAIRQLGRAHKNAYEIRDQFTLVMTDYQGIEWHCGWTRPEPQTIRNRGWLLKGRINSLVTRATGDWVSDKSSIELVFQPKFCVPMSKSMLTVTSIDDVEIERKCSAGQQTVQVLDSEVTFFYRPSSDTLWLTAETSTRLRHPYAENWVCEPLRILLGQRIYPRLVARNFGDRTAHVWLRPSLGEYPGLGVASLLGDDHAGLRKDFWKLYASLLQMIAEDRTADGHPNFEPHAITRFYDEIIRATQGSRWVLCMTLSSVAEGLVRLLIPCNPRAKIDNHLKALVCQKILRRENQVAWTRVRHEVMHGNLVSPWGTEEEDKQLSQLIDLIRRLTRKLIEPYVGEDSRGTDRVL